MCLLLWRASYEAGRERSIAFLFFLDRETELKIAPVLMIVQIENTVPLLEELRALCR